MGVLIDASVLIQHERSGIEVEPHLEGRADEPFYLSVITVSELLHGVHRADTRARRARRSVFVEAVIDRFPALPLDLPTARIHAEIGAELRASGTPNPPIGVHDLWLAAAALAHGLVLVTANLRDFRRVPALEVERWG